MRLDKWLKVARVIKRRPVAHAICEQGRVQVNGRAAKPALKLKPGDRLVIRFGQRELSLTVLGVPEKQVAAKLASELYQVESELRLDEAAKALDAELPAQPGESDDED